MYLVEIHRIERDSPHYKMLCAYCAASMQLYNGALYLHRQFYIYSRNTALGLPTDDIAIPQKLLDFMSAKQSHRDVLSYYDMDKLAKLLLADQYRRMPTAVSAQQTLKAASVAMDNYKKAIGEYRKNGDACSQKPKMPGLRRKYGMYPVTLTGQSCRVGNGRITFPKAFHGLALETRQEKVRYVQFIPRGGYFQVDVCYEMDEPAPKADNGRYMAICIGTNNLAAVTNNFNGTQWLINGRPLKSIVTYYDDLIAHYRGLLKNVNKKHRYQDADSKRIERLWKNRNDKVGSYLHKASRKIIELAERCDACKIIVGYNEQDLAHIKSGQGSSLLSFKEMLAYKGRQTGIEIVTVDESYTFSTSYLDRELPAEQNCDGGRRLNRGAFRANNGRIMNSDCNASYQLLRKYDPNFYVDPKTIKVIDII